MGEIKFLEIEYVQNTIVQVLIVVFFPQLGRELTLIAPVCTFLYLVLSVLVREIPQTGAKLTFILFSLPFYRKLPKVATSGIMLDNYTTGLSALVCR